MHIAKLSLSLLSLFLLQSQEEDDYKVWLEGKEGSKLTSQEKRELDSLKQFWTDPHLDKGEVFLRDYILNKGYMDKDAVRWAWLMGVVFTRPYTS